MIPSKGRSETIKTHKLLDSIGLDYKIILHNESERNDYLKNKTINPDKILVSNAPFGILNQRMWIWDNLIEDGEWFITMDDNIDHFTALSDDLYYNTIISELEPNLKSKFETNISTKRAFEIFEETKSKAEEIGACLCGFATVDNFYFRTKKWRDVGYVITKLAIIKKTKYIKYDPKLEAMEDYGFTAQNLLKFGKVLINNYLFPIAGHYEKGGIGTYSERTPRKVIDCEYLMIKYPGLFRYKVKSGCHPKAELQIRFTSSKQVFEWRNKMLKGINK